MSARVTQSDNSVVNYEDTEEFTFEAVYDNKAEALYVNATPRDPDSGKNSYVAGMYQPRQYNAFSNY